MALSHNPSLVTEGLIIYLDANNTSSYAGTGTTWYDLSGNGRHASLISSPSYEGFGGGKYLSFDGSTNYATIPYTITDNLITVGFWYYSKVFSANSFLDALISNYTSGISGFDVRLNSSTTINLAIVIAAAESQISIGTITNNAWYFIAFTYDGATVRTYLDGVFRSSTNVVGARANGTQICIGTSAFDTNRRATCGIPQVMIYNRALSDAEILRNYNATKKRYLPEENIVRNGLILNLDVNKTASYAGTGNTIFDLSGTGTTGTLYNGATFSSANGGSIVFDGTDDGLTYASSNFSTNNFTMEAWVKVTNYPGTNAIFISNRGASDNGWVFDITSAKKGRIYVQRDAGTSYFVLTTNDISLNQWTNLIVTRSGTALSLYRDGTLQSSTVLPSNYDIQSAFANDYAGRYFTPNGYLDGNISSIKYYNRALTSTEIAQNYNALKNRYGLS